jgi:hypothetical protein
MTRLRPVLPYALFAAVTLAAFWKFLFLGHSLFVVVLIENHLGLPRQEPRGWFRSDPPRSRVADNVSILRTHLEVYNRGLKEGELRLWNPAVSCGYPLYADPMVHPFYPPHLALHFLLPPDAAFETGLLLHLFFAGAAMFWLLRQLGRSEAAATAGGLVWMLLGYNGLWFSTGILEGVSVFGPLALRFLHRRRDLADAALAGLSMGLAILGSHPQHALHVFLFAAAGLGLTLWRDRQNRPFAARFATVFVLASVGVGLAAILTRLDTIENGWRVPEGDLATLYDRPWTLPAYALGLFLGKVVFPPDFIHEVEFTLYAGLAATTLAAAGAVRAWRDPAVRFVALFAVAALAAAFLKPLAQLLQLLPILNLSPASRWLFVFGLCVALLSARGLDALAEGVRRVPEALTAIAGLFLAACLVGVGPARLGNGAAIETAIGFALAAAAAWTARARPRPAFALALGAILFELLPPFVLSNWHADPAALRAVPDPVRFARERETEPWRATGALGDPHSAGGLSRDFDLIDGNSALALFGAETAAGFEAIMPAHYMAFALEARADVAVSGRATMFKRFGSNLLDAAGLKYVFTPFPDELPARFRLVREWGRLRLYENTAALPRAYVVSKALPASDGNQAVRLTRTGAFDPRTTVIVEAPELPETRPGATGKVSWRERTPDRLALDVESSDDAFLVLSETDYPGWEAEVDGQPAPIFRANIAFRAVPVPAGRHEVRFRFRPDSARNGVLGSAAFGVLAAAFAVWKRRRNPS